MKHTKVQSLGSHKSALIGFSQNVTVGILFTCSYFPVKFHLFWHLFEVFNMFQSWEKRLITPY